jgi:hypothetical protein
MATPFSFESVADNVAPSGDVCLALDQAGNPSVAFSHSGSGKIVVARRNGGAWSHEDVPNAAVGRDVRPCIAIDSQGNPRLAYQDLTTQNLIYAVRGSGGWSLSTIHTRLTTGHPPGPVFNVAFALRPGRHDPENRDVAYFAYVDPMTDGIRFAHTGNFGPTPIDVEFGATDQTQYANPAVTFDLSDNFFLAYVGRWDGGGPAETSVRLTHITMQGAFPQSQVLEASQSINVRRAPSIARTFSDTCVAYFDSASKTVKAFVSGGVEAVTGNVNTIFTPSAAMNANGGFSIAYTDTNGVNLASRSASGVWTIEVVDVVAGAGAPSLAYHNATAHIAYAANGRMKYATRSE